MAMVGLFQYINFNYLELFKERKMIGYSSMELVSLIQSKINEYNSINYLGSLFSAFLVLSLITKMLFNVFAKVPMPLDKWTIVDIFCSFMNIICFNVIGNTTPDQIIDPLQK